MNSKGICTQGNCDLMEEIQANRARILSITFSIPVKSKATIEPTPEIPVPNTQECVRIKVRPSASSLANTHDLAFFAEFFTERQSFHRTIEGARLAEFVMALAGKQFKSVVIRMRSDKHDDTTNVTTILSNRKGRLRIVHTTEENTTRKAAQPEQKNYLLQEGNPVPFLVYLGVMTPNGKVVNSHRDKFKQINRFLEFIDDILPQLEKTTGGFSTERPLRIVDFGCGKSYLTFAVHYFLTRTRGIPVQITGLDLKEQVVADCNALAKRLECAGLSFSLGDIADYQKNCKTLDISSGSTMEPATPDIVITLHACDTATDQALSYAVRNRCPAILSVPCCQHEANSQLDHTTSPECFKPLLKHGIIKERFAALMTDAVRAELLEKQGYNVQVIEFIDMSHTAKNLLIRAIRKDKRFNTGKKARDTSCLTETLGIQLTLEKLLEKQNPGEHTTQQAT